MASTSANQCVDDILSAIRRHRYESEMTYAEAIGCIEFVKRNLMDEALNVIPQCDDCAYNDTHHADSDLCEECFESPNCNFWHKNSDTDEFDSLGRMS